VELATEVLTFTQSGVRQIRSTYSAAVSRLLPRTKHHKPSDKLRLSLASRRQFPQQQRQPLSRQIKSRLVESLLQKGYSDALIIRLLLRNLTPINSFSAFYQIMLSILH
jgi:hypothetical protein